MCMGLYFGAVVWCWIGWGGWLFGGRGCALGGVCLPLGLPDCGVLPFVFGGILGDRGHGCGVGAYCLPMAGAAVAPACVRGQAAKGKKKSAENAPRLIAFY